MRNSLFSETVSEALAFDNGYLLAGGRDGIWRLALPALLPVTLRDSVAAAVDAAPQPVVVAGTITVGADPSAIAIDPAIRTVFVANRLSNTVSVVDEVTQRVVATVSVGEQPVALEVDPSAHRVYVADSQSGAISVLDGVGHRLVATLPVGYFPGQIAVDPSDHRLYVADQSTDPRCRSGCYDVIRALDTRTLRQQAITSTINAWVSAMAVDPATHDVVFTTSGKYAEDAGVAVLDPALHALMGENLRYWVDGVAVDPSTRHVLVGQLMTNLLILEQTPGQPLAFHESRLTVGVGGHHLAVDPTTTTVYVANASSHTVSVMDDRSERVIATVPIGPPSTVSFTTDNTGPGAIAVDPTTHEVYVADRGGHTVTVLRGIIPTALPHTGYGGAHSGGC